MTCLSGIFCLTMWLPADNVTTVISFVCLYGFSSGIFISVTPAVVAQLSPDDKIGARIGAFFTLAAIATLIGTPIAGTIIDQGAHDPYKNLILFAVRVPEPREDPARHETYLHSIGTYTYDRRTFPTCCPLHVRKESSHKALKCIETTELATWNDRSWRAPLPAQRQCCRSGVPEITPVPGDDAHHPRSVSSRSNMLAATCQFRTKTVIRPVFVRRAGRRARSVRRQ